MPISDRETGTIRLYKRATELPEIRTVLEEQPFELLCKNHRQETQ